MHELVEYFSENAHIRSTAIRYQWPAGMVKTVDQQGRSYFDARSVRSVREDGNMARTPLAAFFNIPMHDDFRILLFQPIPKPFDDSSSMRFLDIVQKGFGGFILLTMEKKHGLLP